MKKAICLLAAILAFSGCSLGEVKDKGADCPPKSANHDAKLGIIGGVECSETDCVGNDVDYTENIQFGYCPVEFSQCGYDSAKDVYYCAKIACEEDEHIYDDDCERDTLRHCGSHENDCKQLSGWKSGKCMDKQCVAEECVDGYEVFKGKCKAKSTDCEDGEHYYSEGSKCEKNTLENCGSHGNNCAELSGWKDGDCSSGGVCLAIDCDSGYELKSGKCVALTTCPEGQHLFNGTCEEDSLQHCGNHETDCTKVTGWGDGSCTNKKCSATACADEYVLNGDKCEARTNCPEGQHLYLGTCESDSIQNCGGHDKDCTSIAGWGGGDCIAGNCSAKACTTGYELNGDKCEALTECPSDQHIYAGSCEPDSIQNCGAHANDCTLIAGWGGGDCVAGNCSAKACTIGYKLNGDKCEALTECPSGQHLYSGTCEADSVAHCGVHGNDCSATLGWKSGNCVNMTCVPNSCKSGYCLNGGGCVEGEANNNACGISGSACKKCTGNDICKNGNCIPNTLNCSGNQHVFENSCEPDDTDNCGSHGNKCSGIAYANGYVCESKTCKPKACLGDYHVYQTICEPNSLTNCGSHDVSCSTLSVKFSSAVTCTNTKGVCRATGCKDGYTLNANNGTCVSFCPEKMFYCSKDKSCCYKVNCGTPCMMQQ